MAKQLSTHSTFTINRTYAVKPARVFRAFSDPAQKTQWFSGGENWKELKREFDFRLDGRELLIGAWDTGMQTTFDCRYKNILENERIIYTYSMHLNHTLISVSQTTVEFTAHGNETLFRYTEQLVCLDGYDDPNGTNRERGTNSQFDRIEKLLVS